MIRREIKSQLTGGRNKKTDVTDGTDGQTYINAFFMELLCLIKNNVYLCRRNMISIN